MRKTTFVEGEYYHIFNRGVEKRNIFSDAQDFNRFLFSLKIFNNVNNIGSIKELSYKDRLGSLATESVLVRFVCYCVNPNHYHFILEQVEPDGIAKFMHRVSTGYTRYFNDRHKRSGSLFQGTFKDVPIDSNEYLLHLSAYVNLNWRVHKLSSLATEFVKSSWEEYCGEKNTAAICKKDIILGQFKNKEAYKKFALESLKEIMKMKDKLKEIEFRNL